MPALAAHLEFTTTNAVAGARVPYSVVNDGPVPIMLGTPYSLERLTDRGWEPLPPIMFRTIGWHLGKRAARQLELHVPQDAPPGRYRFRKSLRADTDPRPESEWFRGHHIDPLELAAEFDVLPSG
jgi:hypothetical protein